MHTLILVLAAAAVGAGQTSHVVPQAGTKVILIDGRSNPELIPDYVLWEHGFGGLAIIRKHNMTSALASLKLADADAELVFKEASAQADRDIASATRQRRRREAMLADGAKPPDVMTAMRQIVLDYRWSVLHARDRLIAAMSPEGRATLLAWMERRRVNIKVSVPEGEMDFFRQPR